MSPAKAGLFLYFKTQILHKINLSLKFTHIYCLGNNKLTLGVILIALLILN